ncbi:MAG TPA: hypothetical protein VFL41_13410 [Gaiellaceae bacterium]|nr:hypothetical protein [Gaiellaceae bacterium]HET8653625.1 hypothetical protein [Gaiellaceae bacterium]
MLEKTAGEFRERIRVVVFRRLALDIEGLAASPTLRRRHGRLTARARIELRTQPLDLGSCEVERAACGPKLG